MKPKILTQKMKVVQKKVNFKGNPPEPKQKFYEYKDMGSWKMKPYSYDTLLRMSSELLDWSRTSGSLYIEKFWLYQNIDSVTFREMRKQCVELDTAYRTARELIAMRREEAVHGRSADREVIMWRQPAYSEEVKDVMRFRSSLREREQKAGASNYIVELGSVPSSDLVPEKSYGTEED